jgi:hypothetical protein
MLESAPAIDPQSPETGLKEATSSRSDSTVEGSVVAGMQKKPEPEMPEVGQQAGVREIGGPEGPEPTRFGDWERKGRCIDF